MAKVTVLDKFKRAVAEPQGSRPGTLTRWLRTHPEAVEAIDYWLEERAAGRSSLLPSDLIDSLVELYGMPRVASNSLINWLKKHRGAAYARA